MKNPMSLDGLISWLERQDRNVRYDYTNNFDCLLCRYFRAVGLAVHSMGTTCWYDADDNRHPLPPKLNSVSVLNGSYGGALDTARAVAKADRS